MISLLNNEDYNFYVVDKETTKVNYKIENIKKYSNNDKNKCITHIKYNLREPTYEIFSYLLINLKFLWLGNTVELNKINFNLYPNLNTLVLSVCHITDKNLCNLPDSIETVVFTPLDI